VVVAVGCGGGGGGGGGGGDLFLLQYCPIDFLAFFSKILDTFDEFVVVILQRRALGLRQEGHGITSTISV
jgi:hypothetical protein